MATVEDDLIWLPLPEAAARLGKSTDALRSMIRRDKLVSRKGNDAGVLVGVPPTVGDGQATADDQATDGRETVELLQATVSDLQGEIGELRTELARVRARLSAAGDLAQIGIEAAQRVGAAETAALNTVNAELRRSLEREQARADRLEAQAQKSWWRRLVG